MEPSFQNKIESALNSLDGLQKAEAPSFFYTRLTARIAGSQNELTASWFTLLRPSLLIVTLSLFLIMNTIMIAKITKQKTVLNASEKPSLQNFASEFDLNNSINY